MAFCQRFIANVSRVFVNRWSHFSEQIAARSPFAPLPLTCYNHDTFYATEAPAGYIDYPLANKVVA